MKALIIFALLVASTVLYFHDKNEGEQVTTLQAQADDLTNQVSQKQQALNTAQAQVRQLTAEVNKLSAQAGSSMNGAPMGAPGGNPPAGGGLQMNRLGVGNPLDQPATGGGGGGGGGRRH